MRLTTWNVNGIRNPFGYAPWNTVRTFPGMFDILGSDIIVMQELKIQRKDLKDDMVLLDGWDCYFSLPKHKKGYSGVGIYTRNATCAPIRAEEGLLGVLPSPSGSAYRDLPADKSIGGYPDDTQIADIGVDPMVLDAEGRCVVLEFPAFVLFGVYSPANSNGLRDDFRYGFICALDYRIRNLIHLGKRVVLVGDLNVSRLEIDTASALEDMRKSGISHEEYISSPNRRVFHQLLIDGEVFGERDQGRETGVLWDTTRGFHPQRKGMYTHWEQKINARPGNYGSRIDFVLVCESMQKWIKHADIQEGLLGSDHCPVFVDFNDTVSIDSADIPLVHAMNPEGTFQGGERKLEWKLQSTPLFSAKRLPEFDKRRSIKSMFAAPSAKKLQKSESMTEEPTQEPDTPGMTEPTYAGLVSPRALPPSGSQTSITKASPSPLNRKRSISASKDKAPKKTKVDAPTLGRQKSLKGFFQTKERAALPLNETIGTNRVEAVVPNSDLVRGHTKTNCALNPDTQETVDCDAVPPRTPERPHSPTATSDGTPSPGQIATQVDNAEQTQRSWGALFARPIAPLCEHTEPCKTMLTKKKGSNQGRSFWMCARPLGPSGEKERGTQWRCSTFIWCSDWTGKKESNKDESVK